MAKMTPDAKKLAIQEESMTIIVRALTKRADKAKKLSVEEAAAAIVSTQWWKDMCYAKEELADIGHVLEEARRQSHSLASDSPGTDIESINKELDAVLQTTEEAANQIMDAAELIQKELAKTPAAGNKTIQDASVEIITSCNFQDISGQRIRKVVGVLGEIAPRIERLAKILEANAPAELAAFAAATAAKGAPPGISDKDLMNGPQLKENAPTQEEVDALFKKS